MLPLLSIDRCPFSASKPRVARCSNIIPGGQARRTRQPASSDITPNGALRLRLAVSMQLLCGRSAFTTSMTLQLPPLACALIDTLEWNPSRPMDTAVCPVSRWNLRVRGGIGAEESLALVVAAHSYLRLGNMQTQRLMRSRQDTPEATTPHILWYIYG